MTSHTNEPYGRLRYLFLRYPRANVSDSFILDDKIFVTVTIQMDGHLPLQSMALDFLLLRARPGQQTTRSQPQSDASEASREEWDRLATLLPDWEQLERDFASI